jgi:hypothetical protein
VVDLQPELDPDISDWIGATHDYDDTDGVRKWTAIKSVDSSNYEHLHSWNYNIQTVTNQERDEFEAWIEDNAFSWTFALIDDQGDDVLTMAFDFPIGHQPPKWYADQTTHELLDWSTPYRPGDVETGRCGTLQITGMGFDETLGVGLGTEYQQLFRIQIFDNSLFINLHSVWNLDESRSERGQSLIKRIGSPEIPSKVRSQVRASTDYLRLATLDSQQLRPLTASNSFRDPYDESQANSTGDSDCPPPIENCRLQETEESLRLKATLTVDGADFDLILRGNQCLAQTIQQDSAWNGGYNEFQSRRSIRLSASISASGSYFKQDWFQRLAHQSRRITESFYSLNEDYSFGSAVFNDPIYYVTDDSFPRNTGETTTTPQIPFGQHELRCELYRGFDGDMWIRTYLEVIALNNISPLEPDYIEVRAGNMAPFDGVLDAGPATPETSPCLGLPRSGQFNRYSANLSSAPRVVAATADIGASIMSFNLNWETSLGVANLDSFREIPEISLSGLDSLSAVFTRIHQITEIGTPTVTTQTISEFGPSNCGARSPTNSFAFGGEATFRWPVTRRRYEQGTISLLIKPQEAV